MEEMIPTGSGSRPTAAEGKRRPEEQLNCPRCKSSNTKFCYYNNYSLTQPRYFCKSCRRYWTEGGSLRNIPVGGGSRKNKKPTPPPAADHNLAFPAAASAEPENSHRGFSSYIPNLMPFSVHPGGGEDEIVAFSFADQLKQQVFSGGNGVDLMSGKGHESSGGYWNGWLGGGPW